ncbi:hypothetical protein [Novisyntrophococcus fermenticellae]|uniref:hypothetical protein n=1 Tax=Novisyntrophococcus fermenticellae TaxID=2068655 RepID=UPI001E5A069D|nr:hypothetical protein [Novisyntrophococcus fermenticellae]
MAINPMKFLQYKNDYEQFLSRHPRLTRFFEVVSEETLKEGTVIEVNVTTENGKNYVSNIRLTDSDVELIENIKRDFKKE